MIKERCGMSKAFNGTDRLQLFGLEIIALISQGKVETIEEIEKHIDEGNLIQYIRDKYHNDMFNTFEDDCPYNLDDWNKAFNGLVDIYKEMKEENTEFATIMKDYC